MIPILEVRPSPPQVAGQCCSLWGPQPPWDLDECLQCLSCLLRSQGPADGHVAGLSGSLVGDPAKLRVGQDEESKGDNSGKTRGLEREEGCNRGTGLVPRAQSPEGSLPCGF